jgi:uncharacterized SAM-binding protein YcdF (DUF218 family)
MYNLISKLFAPLFDPLTLSLLLMVCALLFRKRGRLSWGLSAFALVSLAALGSPLVTKTLVRSLESRYPDPGLDVPAAAAIVVLGGTLRMPSGSHHSSELTDSSDRILTAFRLYRAGKAPLIFCSGGNEPLGGQAGKTPEAVWMARLLEEWNVPASAVEFEGNSINTRENATYTYRALAQRGIRRILLVTSAMHMPRAAGAFRKAGFDVLGVPCDFHSGFQGRAIVSQWLPQARYLADSAGALREWLGLGIYRMRGWTD